MNSNFSIFTRTYNASSISTHNQQNTVTNPNVRISNWCPNGVEQKESLVLLNTLNNHGDNLTDQEKLDQLNSFGQLKALVNPACQKCFATRISPSNDGLMLTWEINDEQTGDNLLEHSFKIPLKFFLENLDHLSPEAKATFKEALFQRREHILIAAENLIDNLDKFEVYERSSIMGIVITEATRYPELTLGRFNQLYNPEQKEAIAQAFTSSDITIKNHAEIILTNLECFTKGEKKSIYTACTNDPKFITEHPELFLNNLKHFSIEQQNEIRSILALQSTDEQLPLLFKHLEHFSVTEQNSIMLQSKEHFEKNLDLVISKFGQFSTEQKFFLENHLGLNHDPELLLENIGVLVNNLPVFSPEQRSNIITVLFKNPDTILNILGSVLKQFQHLSQTDPEAKEAIEIYLGLNHPETLLKNIAPIVNNLHGFPTEVQRHIMGVLLKNPEYIIQNPGPVLVQFPHLTPKEQKVISTYLGKYFPETHIADLCGLDCKVPKMSPQEKLLSLAMLKFHEQHVDYTNGMPPIACQNREINALTYALYRPEENLNKVAVGFIDTNIKNLDTLKVLNYDTFDLKSLFNRVGYHTEKDAVVFTVIHPVVCHLLQCNPMYVLKNGELIYGSAGKTLQEARAEMTQRHQVYNQSNYDSFVRNQRTLIPILKELYYTHKGTLLIYDNTGSCRNRLG